MSIQILFTVYKTLEVRIKQVPSKTREVQILPLYFLPCSSLLPFTHLSSSSFPSFFTHLSLPPSSSSSFPLSSSSFPFILFLFLYPTLPLSFSSFFLYILSRSSFFLSSSFHLPLRLHHSRRGKERLRCPSFPLESQDWDIWDLPLPPTATIGRFLESFDMLWGWVDKDELRWAKCVFKWWLMV